MISFAKIVEGELGRPLTPAEHQILADHSIAGYSAATFAGFFSDFADVVASVETELNRPLSLDEQLFVSRHLARLVTPQWLAQQLQEKEVSK